MVDEFQTKPPSAAIAYFALIPVVVGIVLLGLSIHDSAVARRLELRGTSTTGTVVDLLKVQMRLHNKIIFCPLVRFTADSGAVIQYKDLDCGAPPRYRVGDSVRVFYIPEAPAESAAIQQDRWKAWSGTIIEGLVGLLMTWLGVKILAGLRRARREFLRKAAAAGAASRAPR